jgi:hypothetical protein
MPDTPIDERRFSDQEVREILKRAVERTPSRSHALEKTEGLSLPELQAIATEVGIDPARVEDAARQVVLGSRSRTDAILGGTRSHHVARTVDGEFDPEDTARALSLIRRTMGRQGEVTEVHGSLEWHHSGESGERYLTISSRDGKTTISGAANLTNAAVLTYLPAGILGAFLTFIGFIVFMKDGSESGFVMALATLPILVPILRMVFGRMSRSEGAKLDQAVDEVARLVEGSGA